MYASRPSPVSPYSSGFRHSARNARRSTYLLRMGLRSRSHSPFALYRTIIQDLTSRIRKPSRRSRIVSSLLSIALVLSILLAPFRGSHPSPSTPAFDGPSYSLAGNIDNDTLSSSRANDVSGAGGISALASAVLIAVDLIGQPLFATSTAPGIAGTSKIDFGKLPLSFEPNAGQTDPAVRFTAHLRGGTAFFTPSSVALALPTESAPIAASSAEEGAVGSPNTPKSQSTGYTSVGLQFLDSGPSSTLDGGQILPGKVNYILGNDPAKWHTNLPTYAGIIYSGLYPGVDLSYTGNNVGGGALKGTYIVAAGADPTSIHWRYEGAKSIAVDEKGDLHVGLPTTQGAHTDITTEAAELIEQAPIAWQEIDGVHRDISVRYNVQSDDTVSFIIGDYDPRQPLTIDPTLIVSTYLGSGGTDTSNAVAVDGTGNIYIAGSTNSPSFPLANAVDSSYNGGSSDVFVTKLNAQGTALVYSTYLGGASPEEANDVAVDATGNLYVVGWTQSITYPTTASAWDVTYGGGVERKAFITRLNPAGSALVYSTYLGGCCINASTRVNGVATDNSGNAYVGGQTTNHPESFPVTVGAYQHAYNSLDEGFITKIDTNSTMTSSLAYSTLFGASGTDSVQDISLDSAGNMLVVLVTSSSNFTTTSGVVQTSYGGGSHDALVAALNPQGSALVFSTFLGGSGDDIGKGLAVDKKGNIYVTGSTTSSNFPTQNPLYSTHRGGSTDAFVSKLNPAATAFTYSTYIGGASTDVGVKIAADILGDAYVVGSTNSITFPLQSPITTTVQGNDGFVTRIDPAGSALLYSTPLGGNDSLNRGDIVNAVTLDKIGMVYVTGNTWATNFPTTTLAYQGTNASNQDAFVTKLSPIPDPNAPSTKEIMGPNCDIGCGSSGDNTPHPVNLPTGNFWHSFTDLAVPGRGVGLAFVRTYNSLNSDARGPVTGTLGYGWTHNYNMYIDRDGSSNYIVHRNNGTIVPFNPDFSAPPRVMATLTDTGGVLTFTEFHGQTSYVFRALDTSTTSGKLDHITDRNGYTTSLNYNADGSLNTVTDPASRQITFSYTVTSTVSYLTGVTDPAGHTVSFGYDSSSNLQTATDVGGQHMGFTYENVGGFHRLLTMTDPNGGVLTNQYDSSNRVTTQTDPLSRATYFGYVSGSTRITGTLGNVSIYNYNSNILSQVVDHANAPQSQQAVWEYDYAPGSTLPSSATDPLRNTTSYNWDASGNLLSVTDPLSRTTSYLYNATNDVTTITNTLGYTTTFGYDAYGNVTTITRPIAESSQLITTTLTYDAVKHGDVLTVTNPLGNNWGIRYDDYGYVITSTNPLTESSHFTHNSIGWLLSATTPRGYTSSYTYTTYGEPQLVTDTLGYTTVYTYDNVGNLINARDANGHTSTNAYNLDNELTRATRPDNTHSDYGYDSLGRTITQTNGLGQLTRYAYDDINRVVTYTDNLTRSTVSRFDLAGNLSSVTDAKNQTTTLGYDAAYQLKNINYSDGTTPDVAFDYNNLGMRTVMTDGIGTNTYSYDSLSRLTLVTDGNGKTVSYAYDIASRPTTITYPYDGVSTRSVVRGYNDANRLTSVEDWLNDTTSFGYNQDGALTSITRPNGVTTSVGYDAADQVITKTDAITSTPFLSFTFQLDPVGVLTSTAEANFGKASTDNYNYDTRNRLTQDNQVGNNTPARAWQYDAATQILVTTYRGQGITTITPVTTTRSYDAANQILTLLEKTGGSGGTTTKDLSYTFDDNGNRTSRYDDVTKATTSYEYDQADRLTTAGLYSYGYNGDGLRLTKSFNAIPTADQLFAWDIGVQAGLPLLLQDSAASYIYGPGGMLLEEVIPGGGFGSDNPYYYHTDRLGSVRVTTNSSGAVANTYTYDAYGKTLSQTGSTVNPFGYTGEYTDAESGFVYLRARYYDPESQQFLTVDPALAWTEQAYAYVGGSPTNYSDPTGLVAVGVCFGAGGGAIFGKGGSRCFMMTSSGQSGWLGSETYSVSTGIGVSMSASLVVSPEANSLDDLLGPDQCFGGALSLNKFVAAGYSFHWSNSPVDNRLIRTMEYQISVGLGFEFLAILNFYYSETNTIYAPNDGKMVDCQGMCADNYKYITQSPGVQYPPCKDAACAGNFGDPPPNPPRAQPNSSCGYAGEGGVTHSVPCTP